MSQLIIDEVYARPSLTADYRNVPKGLQYLWRRSDPFERRTRDQVQYLVPYECVKVYAFKDFARVFRFVPVPPRWAFNEVLMGCAVLLPSCILYSGSRLWIDTNSGCGFCCIRFGHRCELVTFCGTGMNISDACAFLQSRVQCSGCCTHP